MTKYMYQGKCNDGTTIEVGENDEIECIFAILRAADEHGGILYYWGKNDEHYGQGLLKKGA